MDPRSTAELSGIPHSAFSLRITGDETGDKTEIEREKKKTLPQERPEEFERGCLFRMQLTLAPLPY
jgi:hypothetical protein